MATSIINRFIRLFADAFTALGAAVPLAEIERLAMAVHCSMGHGQRVYHTAAHVLDMCRDMKPLQVLAALYHDIVYYQLDGGFPRHAETDLRQVVQAGWDKLSLRPIEAGDDDLAMCTRLFGFRPGDTLPLYGGMNEFLSAVVAVRALSPWLRRPELLAIVAGIEATVPFRGADAEGRAPAEALAARLRETNDAMRIGLDDAAIDAIVHDAVVLANRDVGNFAGDDAGYFLSATWMLIEESNAPLTRVGVYSIQDYRKALRRMEGFLASLDPAHIFHGYRNVPDAAEMARLAERSAANLRFTVDYLGAKLASIALIEAMALVTGGDAPVSMFLGDIMAIDGRPDRIEDFLPPPPARDDLDTRLLAVLEKGRSVSSSNDLTASPLTAYLYRCLGPAGMNSLLAQARLMFAGELGPVEFLLGQPPGPVCAIADGCARIALSRGDRLRELRQRLERG